MIKIAAPAVIKAIAQVAGQMADKKKRERMFAIIGGIIMAVVLLLMMVWYIITAPLNLLQGLFSELQMSVIEEMRANKGFPALGFMEAGIVEGFYDPFPGINWGVSSPFGLRTHPISGRTEMHTGVDIAWYRAYGTPIGAVADGVVTLAGTSRSAGNWVIIYHGDIGPYSGVVSVYMHNTINRVTAGQIVSAGDIIGNLGTTGYSTGPHLHLEIRVGGFDGLSDGRPSGVPMNPLYFIGLPGMRDVVAEGD